jgi:hypothetical protein
MSELAADFVRYVFPPSIVAVSLPAIFDIPSLSWIAAANLGLAIVLAVWIGSQHASSR